MFFPRTFFRRIFLRIRKWFYRRAGVGTQVKDGGGLGEGYPAAPDRKIYFGIILTITNIPRTPEKPPYLFPNPKKPAQTQPVYLSVNQIKFFCREYFIKKVVIKNRKNCKFERTLFVKQIFVAAVQEHYISGRRK